MKYKVTFAAGLSVALALLTMVSSGESVAPEKRVTRVERRPLVSYGKLRPYFERNLGQASSEVLFLSRGIGHTIHLSARGAIVVVGGTTIRLSFVGANIGARTQGEDALPGTSNYFVGNDPTRWVRSVPHFAEVRVETMYPGIDLLYYMEQGHLAYDFLVKPGGDPRSILFRIEGVDSTRLDEAGNLRLETTTREVALRKPIAYQDVDGRKREIAASYDLSKIGERLVGFRFGAYDTKLPLVVDPVLSYSTYFGGTAGETGNAIAVDAIGNTYVAGQTGSLDLPTENPRQGFGGGLFDGFISKISADGSTLLFSTYLGGSGSFDQSYGLAVDEEGNAYLVGETTSADFPLTNPIQGTYGGGTDAYIAKLSSDGSTLHYSTFLGGSAVDKLFHVVVDSAGNAFVAGYTASTNFPTMNALQTTYGGGSRDAVVVKIDASGTSVDYSTFLGGTGSDEARGVAYDSEGSAYVTGFTRSSDFPLMNPIQSMPGGSSDIFVAKVHATGSALVYSTYLGGSLGDDTSGTKVIEVDGAGCAYVTGGTRSANFPVKNAVQSTLSGGIDAFVAKIAADGSELVYSTYLGGSTGGTGTGYDDGYGIAVDRLGNAYVVGRTESSNFPVWDAIQPSHSGGAGDGFVSVLRVDGSALIYSTYLGGTGEDRVNDVALDGAGNVHLGGQTASSNFPTVNALQPTMGGSQDALVARIGTVLPPAAVTIVAWDPVSRTTLNWSAAPGASIYHGYRGAAADLPKLLDASLDSCLRFSTAELSSGPLLVEDPQPGAFFWYLVRAENANGLGPAGNATAGPRVHDPSGSCP